MRAAFITRFGPPEVLRLYDVPLPVPGEGEVLVRTRSIGLNFADVMARLGVYPGIPKAPFVPGIEFCGVVEAVGRSVTSVREGERVMGFSRQGAYAEAVCTLADFVRPIPDAMSFEEGAAFGVTAFSAFHGLRTLAHIQRGEKLLLHAAAGGVGTAALQLCREWGVEVFASASNGEKLALAKELGASHVINYSTEDFGETIQVKTGGYGIDVVMDSVGGRIFRQGWNLLAPMGRYVLYGFASVTGPRRLNPFKAVRELIAVPLLHPPSLVSKNRSLLGFNLYFLSHKTGYWKSIAEELFRLYHRGVLRPVIGARFPFEQIAGAQAFLQSRRSFGKVVVTIES